MKIIDLDQIDSQSRDQLPKFHHPETRFSFSVSLLIRTVELLVIIMGCRAEDLSCSFRDQNTAHAVVSASAFLLNFVHVASGLHHQLRTRTTWRLSHSPEEAQQEERRSRPRS